MLPLPRLLGTASHTHMVQSSRRTQPASRRHHQPWRLLPSCVGTPRPDRLPSASSQFCMRCDTVG